MTRSAGLSAAAFALLVGGALAGGTPDVRFFFEAASPNEQQARDALQSIAASWRDNYAALIVDLARLMPKPASPGAAIGEDQIEPYDDEGRTEASPFRGVGLPSAPAPSPVTPAARSRIRLVQFLEKMTGQRFGQDLGRWRRWMWSLPYEPHPQYAVFKSAVYSRIDPRMAAFFPPGVRPLIRLDEVDWGGVKVNGIPPLDHPKTVTAAEAGYLQPGDLVFGVCLNGEARAYPKRILAWHELARDTLGGREVTVVYCTLCGSVVPYDSEVGGRRLTFGTSGLLYRSNKLMFDEETMSLWSAAQGRPVVGMLAGSGLRLQAYPVVTTAWRDWVQAHPRTTVLSLDTGYRRDYSEGAAYRDYFATDRLMFEVPKTDTRLKNKAEVLALLVPSENGDQAVAISADFLRRHRLHAFRAGGRSLAVVTTPDGANRVYDVEDVRLSRQRADGMLEDERGGRWRIEEDALVEEDGAGRRLERVAAWRAFWFGWYAQFPETDLIR